MLFAVLPPSPLPLCNIAHFGYYQTVWKILHGSSFDVLWLSIIIVLYAFYSIDLGLYFKNNMAVYNDELIRIVQHFSHEELLRHMDAHQSGSLPKSKQGRLTPTARPSSMTWDKLML